MHQCAYIGDDSSEELEEMEANVAIQDPIQMRTVDDQETSGSTNESNQPNRMRRISPGVHLHGNQDPINSNEKLTYKEDSESDYVDNIMLQLLQNIGRVKAKIRGNDVTPRLGKANASTVTESPTNLDDKSTSTPTSSEVFEDVLRKLQKLGDRGKSVLRRLNKQLGEAVPHRQNHNQSMDVSALRNIIREMFHEENVNSTRSKRGITLLQHSLNVHDEEKDAALEEVSK